MAMNLSVDAVQKCSRDYIGIYQFLNCYENTPT